MRAVWRVLAATGMLMSFVGACLQGPAAPTTPRDDLELAGFTADQEACLRQDASLDAKRQCVGEVRDAQCTAWRKRFDAEVCP